MKKQILIIISMAALVLLISCSKKADVPEAADNAATEQAAEQAAAPAAPAIPPDPAIDASALLGEWRQTVDDDPSLYIFMENGKCKAKGLTDNEPRDCTYEIKTPDKTGTQFNMLIVNFPASGDQEQYYTQSRIRFAGELLTFPDEEGIPRTHEYIVLAFTEYRNGIDHYIHCKYCKKH